MVKTLRHINLDLVKVHNWATILWFFNCLICTMVTVLWHLLSYSEWYCRLLWGGFWVWWCFCDKLTMLCDITWLVTFVTPCRVTIHPVLKRTFGIMFLIYSYKFTVLCDTTWHVTVVTLCRVTMHPVLGRIFGTMIFFFDKLTVLCDTTWHVTVVTLCRVTMQGAMGGGRGLTPAATKSRAFHTEQLEQAT